MMIYLANNIPGPSAFKVNADPDTLTYNEAMAIRTVIAGWSRCLSRSLLSSQRKLGMKFLRMRPALASFPERGGFFEKEIPTE
jgi:hypothetical protein